MNGLTERTISSQASIRAKREIGDSPGEKPVAPVAPFVTAVAARYRLRGRMMSLDLRFMRSGDFTRDTIKRTPAGRRGFRVGEDYTNGKLLIDEQRADTGNDIPVRAMLLTGDGMTGPTVPTRVNATGLPNYTGFQIEPGGDSRRIG